MSCHSADGDKITLDGIRDGDDSKKSENHNCNTLEIEANLSDTASVADSVTTETSIGGTRYRIMKMAGYVIPKVEPIKWTTFFCLSIWCIIP